MSKLNTSNHTKRFLTIAEYCRATGLSYKTVKAALESGQLFGIKTESGNWKIDTQADINPDVGALASSIEEQGKLIKQLCKHLGVAL